MESIITIVIILIIVVVISTKFNTPYNRGKIGEHIIANKLSHLSHEKYIILNDISKS